MLAKSMLTRRMSFADKALAEVGRALQVLGGAAIAQRPNPAGRADPDAEPLSPEDRRKVIALMRVDHVGEVCAQALYRGQSLFCRDTAVKNVLDQAATEEVDHLAWCSERISELQGRPSYLNPLWYAGSFSLGMLAGATGVGKNMGFMAETEAQVEDHLTAHLQRMPASDVRSRRILEQMRDDEIGHGNTARRNGAHKLPLLARLSMKGMAKVMTRTAYWL